MIATPPASLASRSLELLFIVIRRGLFNLPANLIYPALDLRALAVAFNQGSVFLVHGDVLDAAEFLQS